MKLIIWTLFCVNCVLSVSIHIRRMRSTGENTLPEFRKICTGNNISADKCTKEAVLDIADKLYKEFVSLRSSPQSYNSNQFTPAIGPTRIYNNSNVTEVNIYFPKIVIQGLYQADVKFKGLETQTSGPFSVTLGLEDQSHESNANPPSGSSSNPDDVLSPKHEINSQSSTKKKPSYNKKPALLLSSQNQTQFTTSSRTSEKTPLIGDIPMGPKIGISSFTTLTLDTTPKSKITDEPLQNQITTPVFSDITPIFSSKLSKLEGPGGQIISSTTEEIRETNDVLMVNLVPAIRREVAQVTPSNIATESSTELFNDLINSSSTTPTISRSPLELLLTDLIEPCYEDDPKYNLCIKQTVYTIIPILFNASKPFQRSELTSVEITRADIRFGEGNAYKNITFEDAVIYGMDRIEFREIGLNIYSDSIRAEVNMFHPKLFIEGTYKALVDYRGLKLQPTGYFNVTMSNVEILQKWKLHFLSKNQHKYLQIDEIEMIPDVGSAKTYLSGAFPDAERNNMAIEFLNQNWNIMYKLLMSASRIYWEPLMINALNEFLGTLPFDLLSVKEGQVVQTISSTTEDIREKNVISHEVSEVTPSNIATESSFESVKGFRTSSSTTQAITGSSLELLLSDFIKPCYEDDPKYDLCIKQTVYKIMPILFNASNPFQRTELKSVEITRADIRFSEGNAYKNITFEDAIIYGMDRIEFREIGLNIYSDGIRAEVNLFYPTLCIEGTYKALVDYRGLKLQPTGYFNVTMSNVEILQKWKLHFLSKNQHKYLQIDEIEMIPDVGSANSYLTGAFSDAERNNMAIGFLNQNWNIMYKLLMSTSRAYWEPLMIAALNEFLETLPFDLLSTKRTLI